MKKIFLGFCFMSVAVCAQQPSPADSTIVYDINPSTSTTVAQDTVIRSIALNTANASDVSSRLSALRRTIPLPYNETVHGFIDFFIYRKPSYTKLMLERENLYMPLFETYLSRYDMPDELKYLAVVESGLNPKAVSRARAVGLWQFMRATGNDFGLRVTEHVDDRMNIEKSTEAACKYLKSLYNQFGDWHLALAAYNTGPGNVRRAIRKAGGVYDFWTIYRFLPKETRSYVPQFIALTYMMNHANDHGIYAENVEEPIPSFPIIVDSYLDINALASLSNMELDDIQKLNPQLLKDVLPASTRGFELKLPSANYAYFTENRQSILDSVTKPKNYVVISSDQPIIVDGVLIDPRANAAEEKSDVVEDINSSGKILASDPEEILKSKKVRSKTYLVRRGDNLFQIADKFDVEVYDIKKWNGLRSSHIEAGERLKILVDDVDIPADKYVSKAAKNKAKKKIKYHTVRSGDTLWSISQRYDITVKQLKKLNGLRSNSVMKGARLKIS